MIIRLWKVIGKVSVVTHRCECVYVHVYGGGGVMEELAKSQK